MPMIDIWVWREGKRINTGQRYERTPKKIRGKAKVKALKRARMAKLKSENK